MLVLLLVAAFALTFGYSAIWTHKIWWNAPDNRGAATVKEDRFGDSYTSVKYLDQAWKAPDSLWFYTTTQGSDLLPYDFFVVLEQADSREPFLTPENMNRYRYLPQDKTSFNPDGLPVGMVADTYKHKTYMGFTCAACHTSQINYKGTGIRIDGGQAAADMNSFMNDLGKALAATQDDGEKKKRFVEAVLKRGEYSKESDVLADLDTFASRIGTYNFINATDYKDPKVAKNDPQAADTQYGYGRLDAFGRIFNRVLQHIVNGDELSVELKKLGVPEDKIKSVLAGFDKVPTEEQRDRVVRNLTALLSQEQQEELRRRLFNSPNAPVSYPFLWDTPQHDYLQWNGIAKNSGEGPIGRNSGEVIGVFATLDWSQGDHWTLSSLIGGQGFAKPIEFDSSVNLHNLQLLESKIGELQSPRWPEDILGRVNAASAVAGGNIFDERCAGCHAKITRDDPDRHVIAFFSKLSAAGTDDKMAKNAGRAGYAGILSNQYVDIGAGSIYLKDKVPVAALLTKADLNVVATPDPDKPFFVRWADWAHDLAVGFWDNKVKPSMKAGNYDADTTAAPLNSLMAYKARPLNGIWATAPYLHNGSVPTLYDLLLPAKKEPEDRAGMEYRPATFITGSREFDPERVGFRSQGYKGFEFNTAIYGNGNSGHEYGTRDVKDAKGKVVERALTKDERVDLVEYLKTL